jgi:hypothetical protein
VTPLPWKLGPTQDTVDDANGVELLRMQDHVLVREYDDHLAIPLPYAANAAFIVRAVNSHEALVAALKAVEWIAIPLQLGYTMTYPMQCATCGRHQLDGHNSVCRVAAALAKAEGGES